MLDHFLDDVLLTHLKTAPALAALNGYTGQDNADHKLPALAFANSHLVITSLSTHRAAPNENQPFL